MPGGKPENWKETTLVISDEMRQAVSFAAGIGLPKAQICRLIINPITMRPIGMRALDKHFAQDLLDGLAKANHKVSSKAYELACAGNVNMIIWWEKTRQGRYEKRDFRGMAKGGELDVSPEDLSKLSNEQIQALEAVLAVVARGKDRPPPALPPAPRMQPRPDLHMVKS